MKQHDDKRHAALRLAHQVGRGFDHAQSVLLAEAYCELWDELDAIKTIPSHVAQKPVAWRYRTQNSIFQWSMWTVVSEHPGPSEYTQEIVPLYEAASAPSTTACSGEFPSVIDRDWWREKGADFCIDRMVIMETQRIVLQRELAEIRGALRRSDAENDELRQENGALSAASATACSGWVKGKVSDADFSNSLGEGMECVEWRGNQPTIHLKLDGEYWTYVVPAPNNGGKAPHG